MSFLINEDGVDREPTANEIVDFNARQAMAIADAQEAAEAAGAAAATRASALAKLAKLGLTDSEIAALIGA